VFFAEHIVGKRMIQHYKKIKQATVMLSPGRKTKTSSKKVLMINTNAEERLTPSMLSTSFRLKTSLNQEKFWRALVLPDYGVCREIFFGISPTGIRIVTPDSLDPEQVIASICISDIKFNTYLGSPTLLVKYYQDSGNAIKIKKLKFHVLPVTAQEMLRWYDNCTHAIGEIQDPLISIPILKQNEDPLSDNVQVGHLSIINAGDTEGKRTLLRRKSSEFIPSSLQLQTQQIRRKESKALSKSGYTNINNIENQPPQKSKSAVMNRRLNKSKSFIYS